MAVVGTLRWGCSNCIAFIINPGFYVWATRIKAATGMWPAISRWFVHSSGLKYGFRRFAQRCLQEFLL